MSVCDNFILVIIFFLSDLINKCVNFIENNYDHIIK